MWADRIDHLKRLRDTGPRVPYEWVPVGGLVPGDRVDGTGQWLTVLDTETPRDGFQRTHVTDGAQRWVVDYSTVEVVKAAVPRPEGSWTDPAA